MDTRNNSSSEKKRSFVKVNEEDLIQAIKDYPELYDCTNSNFKRHANRNAAWSAIAKKVGLSESEAKKRWRSLRDGFIKHVKQHDEETRGSMLHYDLLKFLIPYVTGSNARTRTPSAKKRKSIVSNIIYIRNDSDEHGTEYIRAVDDDGNIEEMDINDELSDDPNILTEIEYKEKPISKHERVEIVSASEVTEDPNTETYTIEEAIGGGSEVKFNRSYSEQNFDSDERFLLSLSPTLKRLNTKKNTLARIKIQQMLFELEFEEKF